jgi:hypothetical protein
MSPSTHRSRMRLPSNVNRGRRTTIRVIPHLRVKEAHCLLLNGPVGAGKVEWFVMHGGADRLPDVRHERRAKGREAAFGSSARWRGSAPRALQRDLHQAMASSSLSSPRKISDPCANVGNPKIPFDRAKSVLAA